MTLFYILSINCVFFSIFTPSGLGMLRRESQALHTTGVKLSRLMKADSQKPVLGCLIPVWERHGLVVRTGLFP